MSRFTITSTTWGELKALYTPEGQIIRSTCKICHRVTEQLADIGANPFLIAKPEHETGCKFHPEYVAPVAPTRQRVQAVAVAPPSTYWTLTAISAVALGIGLLIGYFL